MTGSRRRETSSMLSKTWAPARPRQAISLPHAPGRRVPVEGK